MGIALQKANAAFGEWILAGQTWAQMIFDFP